MIERPGADKTAILKDLDLKPGEIYQLDRQEVKEYQADFSGIKEPDLLEDLCTFFKELAKYEEIEGMAISSQPDKQIHVDYFCHGKDGSEIGSVIAGIDLARYFVGNPLGSIQWIRRSFEESVSRFELSLANPHHPRSLLLITRFI